MALSRGSSNGPDWKDVARALLSFQETMSCRIAVMMSVSGSERSPVLLMTAQALQEDPESGAQLVLGSASVSMPGSGAGDMCAALLSLGYELDKDVYRRTEGVQRNTR